MYQQFRPAKYEMLPPVVKNLLIINGLFFAAKFVFQNRYGIDLSDYLGLHYWGSSQFRPWQFITYQFMHANVMHIVSNMLGLYLFGYMLENLWGSKRFLIFYLVTGMGAALIHYGAIWWRIHSEFSAIDAFLAHPGNDLFQQLVSKYNFASFSKASYGATHSTYEYYQNVISYYQTLFDSGHTADALNAAVSFTRDYRERVLESGSMTIVGASGSLFGVLMGVGMLYPNSPSPFFFGIPIKWMVILYGGGELISAFSNRPNDYVAHFAHLGGMIFGFILVKIYARNRSRFY